MKSRNLSPALVLLACCWSAVFACKGFCDGPADNRADQVRPIPPPGIEIPASVTEALGWRCKAIRAEWQSSLESLRKPTAGKRNAANASELAESLASEVLVFPRAVELAIEFGQFYKPNDPEIASQLLDEAMRRLKVVQQGGSWGDVVGLENAGRQQLIVGGYRSKIDGSHQPYSVVVPSGLVPGDARPRRLDLWFHGRGETLSELTFLSNQSRSAGEYTPADTFVLHPYGRYSNAFKFAGEIDVLEALDYVRTRLPVDAQRISVRGFSMGGAACWQFATHYADRWFAANPGAGFSETPEFLRFFQDENVRETAPDYQQQLWQLYDCPPWALNLTHCPTVAYSGEMDRQKQAADVMEQALESIGIDLVHVIGPQTAHKIHPASKQVIEDRMAGLADAATAAVPPRVAFTTSTLRYHRMHWVDVRGLGKHWQPAQVIATLEDDSSIRIATENVTRLRLDFHSGQWLGTARGPISVKIDDSSLTGPPVRSDRSWQWELELGPDGWQAATGDTEIRKRPGLQGPIDDALMDSFVFVLPSGRSDDPLVQTWIEAESQHAMLHWRKHFRGDIRVSLDTELSEETIASANLILFGDPQSNQVIDQVAERLPITWDDGEIAIADHKVPRQGHVPVLVYPNPLNPDRYVVINSGFTFREYDYLNNARQTPKLPDWALVDIRKGATMQLPGEIRAAGFFDERWQP